MAAQFQFIARSGPETGKIYPLEGSEIIIGRDMGNNIAINDAEISRRHAKLNLQESSYTILDLNSTNGTFINGQRISTSQLLNPGDTVSLGENIVLLYEAVYDPNATIASGSAPKTVAPAVRSTLTPVSTPVPTPTPAPAQMYSGQVPGSPDRKPAVPVKKSAGKVIIIILAVLLLCLILACLVFFVWVDSGSRWCTLSPLRWIVNTFGSLFGYGMCQ